MINFSRFLRAAMVVICLPAGTWACEYPAPLRAISATLMSVQDSGGQVRTYHRARLRQALGRMDISAVRRDMAAALDRADRRSVATVLTLSSALANGIGRTLGPREATQVAHLATAIRTVCLAETQAKAPNTTSTTTLEQGDPQTGKAGVPGLTFYQGLARLSLTFTIYMTFLAFVIGLRRVWKTKVAHRPSEKGPPPGGRAFSPRKTDGISGF